VSRYECIVMVFMSVENFGTLMSRMECCEEFRRETNVR